MSIAAYLRLFVPVQRARWSIAICRGASLTGLKPVAPAPALTRSDVPGVRVHGVADPFLIRHQGRWLLFFEIENADTGRGEIALARSTDLIQWDFGGVVLREPFHLSYPHVFEHEGAWYMVPESVAAQSVHLYRADSFPTGWRLHAQLLQGDLADATPFQHERRWWIMAVRGYGTTDELVLFHAESLAGPWHPHALNPVLAGDRRKSRPAGRVVRDGAQLIRFAQDCETNYGRAVRAYAIDELTPSQYREHTLNGDVPILAASGHGWNATGMHHIDAGQVAPGEWVAASDGRETVTHWPILDKVAARWGRHARSAR